MDLQIEQIQPPEARFSSVFPVSAPWFHWFPNAQDWIEIVPGSNKGKLGLDSEDSASSFMEMNIEFSKYVNVELHVL